MDTETEGGGGGGAGAGVSASGPAAAVEAAAAAAGAIPVFSFNIAGVFSLFNERQIQPVVFPENYNPDGNWFHSYIKPRSIEKWHQLIQSLKSSNTFTFPTISASSTVCFSFPPAMGSSFDSTNPSPWYHQKQVGECLEQWWLHNQRIRWICKKWLNAVRCRIMSRRAHGLTGDIGTCEAIPANHLVRVYDWPSRSVYHFHTYTIQKSVVAALKYQYFGISYPSVPKNPYTNLAWSYAQLIVLLEQCQTNLWLARRRYMDAALIQFVGAGYDLLEFEKRYRRVLDIECARAFFMDPTTDGWMEIYEETLTDLLDLMKIYGVDVKSYVMARSLPADMLSKWDEVVMAYWIFENHHRICLKDAEDLMDILEYAQKLVGETRRWLGREREVLRRRRRPVVHQMRRTPNPVFGAQGAFMFTPVQPMSPPRFPSDAEATSISTPTSPPHPLEPISPMVATAAAVVDTTGMTPLETIDQILATVERAMRTIESCDEMRIGPVDVGSPESPETTDPPQESDAPAAVNSDEL